MKYTVITGASSGIGRAAAESFAKRGKNLILTARRENLLEALRETLHQRYPAPEIVVVPADLSAPENACRFYDALQEFPLETWVNNAGFGNYASVPCQRLDKALSMLRLNVEAVTILSTLFARDYRDAYGAQLINVSSCGGYTIVPDAVTYCASKFYVSAFTEGLAHELKACGAALRAKVLAPAATRTEFGRIANDAAEYDYDRRFGTYHTSEQAAEFLMRLYDSNRAIGIVDRETFQFRLCDALFPYAGGSAHNQS